MNAATLTRDVGTSLPSVETLRDRVLTPAGASVAALTVLAAVLRFTRLGHQGFWFDEGNTALLVHFSPGKMLGLIPQSESTPPLYYCLAWIWARVFGYGETGLRSLSALAGVLSVPVLYGAGARLSWPRAGLIAAALAACNPLLIWYSQEARSYSLLVLFSALSLLGFVYVRAEPTTRAITWWVIACAAALTTHYYCALVVVPEALWLLACYPRLRRLQAGIAAVALVGIALIPLAISQNQTGHASWIAPIPLGPRLNQIFPSFLVGFQAPAVGVLYPIAAVVVLVSLVLLAVRGSAFERRGALCVGVIAFAGLALNLVLVAAGIDDLIARNVIALWPAGALLVAAGLAVRRASFVGIVAAVVLCLTGVVAAVGVASDRSLQRPDWRAVAHLLGPEPAAGAPARAIFVQHYRDLLPLSLYVGNLKFWPHRQPPAITELDVVSFSAPRYPLCWWGAGCNLSGTRMQSSYPVPGFHELWRREMYQFSVMRLVADHPLRLTDKIMARALTTTRFGADELLIQRRAR